jgi:hypothetical protein
MLDARNWALAFRIVVNTVSKHFASSLATVFLALVVMVVWTGLQHEDGFFKGIKVEFLTTREQRARDEAEARRRDLALAVRLEAVSSREISDSIGRLLGATGADRVHVTMVHDGTFNLAMSHLMRADIIAAVAEDGIYHADSVVNEPLAEWHDFLPEMVLGEGCKFVATGRGMVPVARRDAPVLTSPALQARMQKADITAFVACKIESPRAEFLGGLFVLYNTTHPPPDSLAHVLTEMRIAAAAIGAVMVAAHPTVSVP